MSISNERQPLLPTHYVPTSHGDVVGHEGKRPSVIVFAFYTLLSACYAILVSLQQSVRHLRLRTTNMRGARPPDPVPVLVQGTDPPYATHDSSNETIDSFRPTPPQLIIDLDSPPSSEASSSPTCSSSSDSCDTPASSPLPTPPPSSPSPSFVYLRPALKSTSSSILPKSSSDSGRSTPVSCPTPKNVRFSAEMDETRIFEYPSWEALEKKSNRTSLLGKWRKDGKTIIWQDDASSSSKRRSSSEDSHASSSYSWLLGGAGRRPSGLSFGMGGSGMGPSMAYSPPARYPSHSGYGDDSARWREGMY